MEVDGPIFALVDSQVTIEVKSTPFIERTCYVCHNVALLACLPFFLCPRVIGRSWKDVVPSSGNNNSYHIHFKYKVSLHTVNLLLDLRER